MGAPLSCPLSRGRERARVRVAIGVTNSEPTLTPTLSRARERELNRGQAKNGAQPRAGRIRIQQRNLAPIAPGIGPRD